MLPEKAPSKFATDLMGKVVVTDTSSLLMTGVGLLGELPSCTFVVPAIVVRELEEKRNHATMGFLAREWLRLFEELRGTHGASLCTGVPHPAYPSITIRIEPNHNTQENLPKHLRDGSNDSTVLAVASNLDHEIRDAGDATSVVLLSNDTPMRLSATLLLKLEAVEFSSTLLDGAKPFSGRIEVELQEDDAALAEAGSFQDHEVAELLGKRLPAGTPSHALVSATMNGQDLFGVFSYANGHLSRVPRKQKAAGITARTFEQDVAMTYLRESAETLPIVSIGGGAGTGKTLMSVAVGLDEVRGGNYQRLIVFRSLHEMGQGQELGFLPGTVEEKMEAWAGAVYDAIDVIAASSGAGKKGGEGFKAEVKKLRDLVEVSPITYLRGRSLSNSYIILDEAQNFSRSELLNILSRVGEGTKLVMIGDPAQVDNRFLQAGSKSDVWSVIEALKDYDLFAHLSLKKTERSRVAEISAQLLSS